MKPLHVVLVVAGVGLLGAAVLLLALWTTVAVPAEVVEPAAARAEAGPSEVGALRDEVAALRRRLLAAEARPEPLPSDAPEREPAGGYVSREEFEAFREELFARLDALDAGGAAVEAHPEADDPLKARVADVLQEVRKEEAVEGVRKYHDYRRERLEAHLETYQEWLGLDSYQVDEMRVALSTHYDREDEQMRRWEEGESDEALGQLKAIDGALFYEDLEAFLGPEQLETFWGTIVEGRGGK